MPGLHHAKETIAGPGAPAVGGLAGLATGTVAGAVGYLGGGVASRRILEVIDPNFLHDAENAVIRDARDRIERSIRNKVAGRCNAKGSLSCSLCVFGL